MRTCDGCGTTLSGKHRHGFVVGRRVLCGRSRTEVTRYNSEGEPRLVKINLPCAKEG